MNHTLVTIGKKIDSGRDTLWLALIFILAIILHTNHILDSDEGTVLATAWDIYNGKKLYTDIFQFVAPGSFYLIAIVFKLLNVSYYAAKYTAILAIIISAIGIYKINCEFYSDRLRLFPPILFVVSSLNWPLIQYHTFKLLTIIWSIYYFVKFIKEKKYKYSVCSAFFAGLTGIFLQHAGIAIFMGNTFFLFYLYTREKNKIYIKNLIIYTLIFININLSLLLFWDPFLLYNSLIYFPFFNYTEVAKTHYNYIYIFTGFILYIIIIIWNYRTKIIYYLLFIQILLLMTAIPLADHYHVTNLIFPIYCLIPLTDKLIEKSKIYKKIIYLLSLIIIINIIIFPAYLNIFYKKNLTNLDNKELFNKIKESCGGSDYIYSGPFLPNFYFELRKKNPSRYVSLITNHHTREQFDEMKEGIEKNKPQCAILAYGIVSKYNYTKENSVDEYISKNYYLSKKIKKIEIYEIINNKYK